MARGWESKDIESQMEEARARREQPHAERSPEEIERERKRESLLLSRKRVMADLEKATHPRHRAQIEASLEFLDRQLAEID